MCGFLGAAVVFWGKAVLWVACDVQESGAGMCWDGAVESRRGQGCGAAGVLESLPRSPAGGVAGAGPL